MANNVKTFVKGVALEPLAADPSGPVEGQVQFSDGTARAKGLWQYKDSAWAAIGAAGSGGINFIDNGDAEENTTGWATYADAAGTSPVDGTGGSPNSTWTRNTSSPLMDVGDFLFTHNSGASRQGEGASYDFSISSAEKASVQRITFDYATSANYVDSDMRVYIYDVTNSRLIEPDRTEIYANTQGHHLASFQTSSDSTSYRLIFHVASSTNTSAYTVNFDNIVVGPSEVARGPIVTDWVSFTPTGSWISNTTYTGKYRRVGVEAEFNISIAITGAPTAATLGVYMPSGLTIDTTKLPGTGISCVVGRTDIWDDSAYPTYSGPINVANSTTISPRVDIAGGASITNTFPVTFANNDKILLNFKVPISGWTSNQVVSEDYGQRQVVCSAYLSGNQAISSTSATKVTFNSVLLDTTKSFDTVTNNRYVIPESGIYTVTLQMWTSSMTSGENNQSRIYVNGAMVAYGLNGASSSGDNYIPTSYTSSLIKGDYVEGYVKSDADTAYSVIGGSQNTLFSIVKIGNNQQVAASEIVKATYTTNAGQSIVNATPTTVVFEDLVEDTHMGMNTSTGLYTFPVSGTYLVSAFNTYANHAAALGAQYVSYIQKNGVDYRYGTDLVAQALTKNWGSGISALVKANKGDTINIQLFQNSGSNQSLQASGSYNWVDIAKIGGIA